MEIIKGIKQKPYKAIFYGAPGTRKSTFCSHAKRPLFINVENGLDRIDCDKTPHIKTWKQFTDAIMFAKQTKDYDTIVIDTIDVLEVILHQQICLEHGKNSIESFGYGKGYILARERWTNLINQCDELIELGKSVIMIAHDQVVNFDNPSDENYSTYTIKINKNSSNLIIAAVDAVFFVQQETIIKTSDNAKSKAVTTGDFSLIASRTPAIMAKNRFNLPQEVPMKKGIFDYMLNYGIKSDKKDQKNVESSVESSVESNVDTVESEKQN